MDCATEGAPSSFTGVQTLTTPTDVFVGNPLDACDDVGGQFFAETVYWDIWGDMPPTPTPTPNPYTKPNDKKTCPLSPAPMAQARAHLLMANSTLKTRRSVNAPLLGPAINFTVTYNQREAQQPSTLTFSNLGSKWTFNWLSYVSDNAGYTPEDATVYIILVAARSSIRWIPERKAICPIRRAMLSSFGPPAQATKRTFRMVLSIFFDLPDDSVYPRSTFDYPVERFDRQ